jgi:xanthine dehydrogenase iron-sulfur cluster and FAD-binding subunit A
VIGAAATQASVEHRATLAAEVPLLDLVFPWISHFQIRNRGTVCGSVAHADPSAELPLCLTALQGEVVLRSKAGRRVLKADQFFQGMLMTAVKPGEIVEEVRFPLRQQGARYAFEEVSMRHADFAIAALAAVVIDAAIELTVGGVADRPQRKAVAGGLQAIGLRRGDHLVVLLQNRWEMATLHWACQFIGVIVTPLNWRAKPDEIDYCASDAEARAIVFQDVSADAVAQSLVAQSLPRIAVGGAGGATLSFGLGRAGFAAPDLPRHC